MSDNVPTRPGRGRRSWGGYLILFMLVFTQLNGVYAAIKGEALSQQDINSTVGVVFLAFVYGMLHKRKWVKWYILAALVTGLGVPLLMRAAGVWNGTVFDISSMYWRQGLVLGFIVLIWEAVAAVIWVTRYGIGSLSGYISKRLGVRRTASAENDPDGATTGSRWPMTMNRRQVVVGLCVGAVVVISCLMAYVYWPNRDLGLRLRGECESIVREAHGEWEGRPIFEKAVSACIMKRGAGLD